MRRLRDRQLSPPSVAPFNPLVVAHIRWDQVPSVLAALRLLAVDDYDPASEQLWPESGVGNRRGVREPLQGMEKLQWPA